MTYYSVYDEDILKFISDTYYLTYIFYQLNYENI